MKKYIIILFAFISSLASAQLDFQQLCLDCAEQNGFYCGDNPENWTQYAPNGCVQTSWLNDGWEDCVDASDENEAVPTVPGDCAPPPPPPCDTVYVTEYETIFDTIVNTVTVYEDILDTLFVDVIEYVDVFVYDTIVEIEYVEFIEYITEYVDCETGLPCNTNVDELINKSSENSVIYNINGQAIREPKGLYVQDGKLKLKIR